MNGLPKWQGGTQVQRFEWVGSRRCTSAGFGEGGRLRGERDGSWRESGGRLGASHVDLPQDSPRPPFSQRLAAVWEPRLPMFFSKTPFCDTAPMSQTKKLLREGVKFYDPHCKVSPRNLTHQT